MKKLDLAPNTPEWLEARTQYRTASEAAIVLGISPFTTPDDFKLIKAGIKKQFYSSAMKQGHDLEAQVREHANAHFSLDFKEEVWVNGDYLASLDGIDGKCLVEIKVSDYSYRELVEGEIPEHYYTQVQQQLHCSPANVGYLYVYSPKQDAYAVSKPIYEEPEYMTRVSIAWDLFDSMPVPEVAVDAQEDGKVINLFQQYASLKHQADSIKEEMDKIKESLVALGNDKGITAGDYKLTVKRGSTTYDYKKAATDAKLDLTKYGKQGKPSHAITIPKNPFV